MVPYTWVSLNFFFKLLSGNEPAESGNLNSIIESVYAIVEGLRQIDLIHYACTELKDNRLCLVKQKRKGSDGHCPLGRYESSSLYFIT